MKRCLVCEGSFASDGWACPHCGKVPQDLGGRPSFAPEMAKENDGFDPDDFALLARLEKGHFWFEGRNRLILWGLGKFFPGATSFLEVGCGNGFVLAEVEARTGMAVSGGEAYRSALDIAAGRVSKKARLYQMDARRIPFREEFDAIGAFDVLEHIREDEAVLRELHAVLKPGGGLLLTVPQHKSLWSRADDLSFHVRRYASGELREKVERAGFRVEAAVPHFFFLLPFVAASRLIGGRKVEEKGPKVELVIHPLLNKAFGWVTGFERWLVTLGFRPPWGSTLFLFARKP